MLFQPTIFFAVQDLQYPEHEFTRVFVLHCFPSSRAKNLILNRSNVQTNKYLCIATVKYQQGCSDAVQIKNRHFDIILTADFFLLILKKSTAIVFF